MSGHTWQQGEGDDLHPEKNVLLAYIRQQLSADTSHEVYQHLAICEPCRHQHATLLLQSGLAYSMPPYPSIIDMLGKHLESPAAAQLALQQRKRVALQQDIALGRAFVLFFLSKAMRIQRQNAKKPASTTIAIRSVPLVGIAVLIISILLVVALVLAFTLSNHTFVPGNFSGGSQLATPSVMLTQIAVQSKPTATATATPTQVGNTPGPGSAVTATPTATATATPIGSTRPYVKVCSTAAELAQSQLLICGANFKPGDRVELFGMTGFSVKEKSEIIADTHGSFSVVWTITNCRFVPGYIFVLDQTRHVTLPFILVTVTIGTCHAPNIMPQPTPTPTKVK
jgi:hypothetical protein